MDLTGGAEKKYDLEGIAIAKDGGFWLSSEGHPKKELKHLLLKVSATGKVEQEITLPENLLEQARRFSLEGVSIYEEEGETKVVVAVQREWKDDPKGLTKLGVYKPASGEWGFVQYPLDAPKSKAGGWVGLSEITHVGDGTFALIERDNKGGPDAALKQVTLVSLKGVTPAPAGGDLPILEKRVVLNLLPAMAASKGWTPDKVEGLAITADGRLLAVTDNDGVDDASGETQFLDLGPASQLK